MSLAPTCKVSGTAGRSGFREGSASPAAPWLWGWSVTWLAEVLMIGFSIDTGFGRRSSQVGSASLLEGYCKILGKPGEAGALGISHCCHFS